MKILMALIFLIPMCQFGLCSDTHNCLKLRRIISNKTGKSRVGIKLKSEVRVRHVGKMKPEAKQKPESNLNSDETNKGEPSMMSDTKEMDHLEKKYKFDVNNMTNTNIEARHSIEQKLNPEDNPKAKDAKNKPDAEAMTNLEMKYRFMLSPATKHKTETKVNLATTFDPETGIKPKSKTKFNTNAKSKENANADIKSEETAKKITKTKLDIDAKPDETFKPPAKSNSSDVDVKSKPVKALRQVAKSKSDIDARFKPEETFKSPVKSKSDVGAKFKPDSDLMPDEYSSSLTDAERRMCQFLVSRVNNASDGGSGVPGPWILSAKKIRRDPCLMRLNSMMTLAKRVIAKNDCRQRFRFEFKSKDEAELLELVLNGANLLSTLSVYATNVIYGKEFFNTIVREMIYNENAHVNMIDRIYIETDPKNWPTAVTKILPVCKVKKLKENQSVEVKSGDDGACIRVENRLNEHTTNTFGYSIRYTVERHGKTMFTFRLMNNMWDDASRVQIGQFVRFVVEKITQFD